MIDLLNSIENIDLEESVVLISIYIRTTPLRVQYSLLFARLKIYCHDLANKNN